MENSKDIDSGSVYPDFIRNLPEVDVPVNGIRGWLLENDRQQIVFFEIRWSRPIHIALSGESCSKVKWI